MKSRIFDENMHYLRREALPGREFAGYNHTVLGTPLMGPFSEHLETAQFGIGCFWGAERLLEGPGRLPQPLGTRRLYPNPTYQKCVPVRRDTTKWCSWFLTLRLSVMPICSEFLETDPTQGMRQVMTGEHNIDPAFTPIQMPKQRQQS